MARNPGKRAVLRRTNEDTEVSFFEWHSREFQVWFEIKVDRSTRPVLAVY